MAISYPVGPTTVPANLTRPPAAYSRRVWLALGGLLLFVVLYALLTGWLGWTAYRLLHSVVDGGGDAISGAIVGLGAALLTIFMVKGLFFMKRSRNSATELEVKTADQPQLFEFLHRLADEARAPRPHRVFLSPRVNASVSYDLSLVNLVFPSKKNLEIGLGLLNVLTLGELKAVLAHEFGHFTQRSMAVGRWLGVAQQIAGHIVGRRDKLDDFVNRLSRIDVRIAWIGWLLGVIIWAIRSLVDSLFSLALRMQRALGRAMEMHADLVAVSLTGSDTLIYALHRLRTADDAWDRTLAFASAELANGRVITDLFAVQSRVIDRMSHVLDDETYRPAPSLPGKNREQFRLFSPELAQPPRMWSTHPANDEREANAKRVYVAAEGDDRSGWMIMDRADALRARISALVIGEHPKATRIGADDAVRALDEQFARPSLETRYRGIYLDRSTVRPAAKPANLYGTSLDGAADKLGELYPESLARDVERLRTANREKTLLRAIHDGILEAPGSSIRHRGRQLRRRDLPNVIAQLDEELARSQQKLWAHDRRVRTAHRAAAARLGRGWEEYLCGLAAVLHYADHSETNIRDAHRALANRVAVATAGGRASKAEIARVLTAAQELYDALSPVFAHRTAVVLDAAVAQQLGIASWGTAFEEFKLNKPTRESIGSWLGVVDGWVNAACGPLGMLRECALDQLLAAEAQVARSVADGTDPGDAPPPSRVPDQYPVILPGGERELQRKLTVWKRFQTADGVVAATARFVVAASIIGAMLGFGGHVGEATVTIYNGLGRPVTVSVGDQTVRAEAFASASVALPPGIHHVTASTTNGTPVESFDAIVEHAFGNYVYNIACAGALVEWTQVYGDAHGEAPRMLGASRWTETAATTLFTDPPTSLSTSGTGGTMLVLSGVASESPDHVLGILKDERDEPAVIAAHARWDAPGRPYTVQWLALAERHADFPRLIAARLAENPSDIPALRAEQDASTGAARDTVCARDRARAAAVPDDGNWQYLAARCIADADERDRAFLALAERWPKNGWLASASGYTLAEDARWEEALAHLEAAATLEPALRPTVAIDVARVRRMLRGTDVDLADLRAASGQLDLRLDAETDTSSESGSRGAYAALAHGDLESAWRRGAGLVRTRPHMVQLIGASDGADSSMIARALDAPLDSSLQSGEIWAHIALGVREGRDVTAHAEFARGVDANSAEQLLRFVEILRTSRDPGKAEASLGRLPPAGRGLAYAIGTVILGPGSPADWRMGAKRLLFATERPYFK